MEIKFFQFVFIVFCLLFYLDLYLKVFVINISKESVKKIDSFFNDLNIKNLEPYFDAPTTLAKTFSLRGVPTSILIDKQGKEFARIIGSIDFDDENFIGWLKTYN